MNVFDALAHARGRGRRVVLVTVLDVDGALPSHAGAKLVVGVDGVLAGTLGCSEFDTLAARLAADALASRGTFRQRETLEHHGEPGALELFVEVHEPEPALIVLGATPVARAVCEVAHIVERRVVLVATGGAVGVPAGVEVKADEPGRYLLAAPPGSDDAVLVSDHDAPWVDEVLRVALASDAAFVGMLGSRRHAPAAVRRLRDAGVPEAHLVRLRVPVGLDIGARSAGEIAVSIVAEVLATARGRHGGPLGLDWSDPTAAR